MTRTATIDRLEGIARSLPGLAEQRVWSSDAAWLLEVCAMLRAGISFDGAFALEHGFPMNRVAQ